MSRQPRANEFLFDVDRFENDSTVLSMSPLARAFYARLLLRLWKLSEVGVVPDSDAILANLCEAGEHWPSIRSDIRSAFDAESRPGHLVQQGMVRTHTEQLARLDEYRNRGRSGGEEAARRRRMRRGNTISTAIAKLKPSSSSPVPVGVGVRVREKKESTRTREGDEKGPQRDRICDVCGKPTFPFDACPRCTEPAPPPESLDAFLSDLGGTDKMAESNLEDK